MRAKWNEPVIDVDVGFIEMTEDGPREGIRAAFCADDIEMFRQGYKCIDCWEPLETAFPEKCPMEWCGFPIREHQAEVFAERFAGSRAVGSRINEDDELEHLARQRFEREKTKRANSRIWVP